MFTPVRALLEMLQLDPCYAPLWAKFYNSPHHDDDAIKAARTRIRAAQTQS